MPDPLSANREDGVTVAVFSVIVPEQTEDSVGSTPRSPESGFVRLEMGLRDVAEADRGMRSSPAKDRVRPDNRSLGPRRWLGSEHFATLLRGRLTGPVHLG